MKKTVLALIVSSLLAPVAFAGADAPLPKDLPPYAQDKPLPVPQIAKRTLRNGLTVWVVPREGLPRVDYVLAMRGAGYSADDAEHPGFAAMLVQLLGEGTSKRSSREVSELAQSLGSSLGGFAGNDGATLSASALASNALPMLQLLAEVTRESNFPAEEVQLAKANAAQALKASEAQPRFRAERAMDRALYGDHPYGRTQPTQAGIAAVTPELLKAEHGRRFHPDRALLVITGRIGEAEALRMAEAAFGDWAARGAAVADTAVPSPQRPVVRELLERKGSVQSTVRLGQPAIAASSPDYVPLRLASTILGGGFSSRVNQKLREEKGYTYGAFAWLRSNHRGGATVGGADVRNEVTGAAIKEFLDEYRRIGSEAVTPEELQMNKRYVAGGYLISNQLQASVAGSLAGNWLLGLPPEFLGDYVPMIQQVSAAQVQAMGRKYFAPEAQSLVVVGDPAAVGEQLKSFGEFSLQLP